MHSEQAYFQRLKKLFYENPKQFMRTFLLIFLPLALIIIAVNMSFYSLITKSRASEAAIEENHVIKLGEMMIYSELKTLEKDMFNLAYHVEQTRFLSESPGVSKALILKEFKSFLEINGKYDHIRIIDESGMERVRVNYDGIKAASVPDSDLQYKGDRPYFREAVKLGHDRLYLSRMDLNMEEGKLEEPHKPVLRLALGLSDKEGKGGGMLVLNYRAEELMSRTVFIIDSLGRGDVMLLSGNGRILYGDVNKDLGAYAFMEESASALRKHLGKAWTTISAMDAGQFKTREGIYTFKTVYPGLDGKAGAQAHDNTQKKAQDTGIKDRDEWKIVSFVSADQLFNSGKDSLYMVLSVSLFCSLLVFFLALLIASASMRRKNAEVAMEKAKVRAEEASELKDKFVALVSHDLKGPITGIMTYLDLIDMSAGEPKDVRVYVRESMGFCENMIMIINDLLNVSRIRRGQLVPRFVFFDLHLLVQKVMREFSTQAARKDVMMSSSIKERSRIYGDQELLYVVIKNLLSNGLKFCRKGDSLDLSFETEGDSIITVSDSGVGIKQNRLDKIFNYEEKTSTKGTDGEEGTGLGLPLSREIIEAHGGNIEVKSEEGKGAAFQLVLPSVKPKVLIIDDEQFMRRLLMDFLSECKANLIEAANGEEALDIMSKVIPHLIILDIYMPGMDGFEVLSRLKSGKLRNIPVIVVTGDNDKKTRERAFEHGAADFVSKPLITEDLLPRVRRFIA